MLVNINMTRNELDQKLDSLTQNLRSEIEQNLEEFFIYMLNMSHEGIHRVFMERDLVLWVDENFELRKKEKQQLFRVLLNSVKLGDKIDTLPCSMTVTFAQHELITRDGKKWYVNYQNFVNGLRLTKIKLLVENEINDGDFYLHIFQELADKNDELGLVWIDPKHGGGKSFMKKLLPRLMERKEMVLCICDRDTDYSSEDCTDEVMKEYKKHVTEDFIGFVAITPGREAENFLSLEIFRLMYPQSDTKVLNELIENQHCTEKGKCFWLYFDTKADKGVYINDILDNSGSEELKKFVQRKKQIEQSDFKTTKFEKFGDNPLAVFLKNSDAQDKFKEFIESEYWELHFQEWVEPILWYLCGEIPQRPL